MPTEERAARAAPSTAGAGRRPPYRNGIARRAQIVDAAWAVFAARGYSTGSLREIADSVGVTPAAIIRHFDSKEHLLVAVLDRWHDETAQLSEQVSMGSGLDYFTPFPALMRFHVEHPGLVELFLTLCAESSDPDHPAREWVATRYADIVARAVEHLEIAERDGVVLPMSPERRVVEARTLFAIMDGLELQWISDPSIDLVAVFEHSFASVLTRWTGRRHTIVDGVPVAA